MWMRAVLNSFLMNVTPQMHKRTPQNAYIQITSNDNYNEKSPMYWFLLTWSKQQCGCCCTTGHVFGAMPEELLLSWGSELLCLLALLGILKWWLSLSLVLEVPYKLQHVLALSYHYQCSPVVHKLTHSLFLSTFEQHLVGNLWLTHCPPA